MKITFLVHNAYGIGGTVRSTANLSGALAERHDVEVVSVHRVADEPALPFDPRVRLSSLIDMREDAPSYEGGLEATRLPNTMFPDKGVDFGRLRYTALHDQRIGAHLQQTDAQVVIATRPILNGYLRRYGQRRCLRVGQEHLSFDAHSDQLREDQNAAVADGLDAFVTVSEADAELYRAALPDAAARVLCIPNGVPEPAVEPSPLNSKVVVAAGRLVGIKRYDRLVSAFAKVAAEHPDWTLRIYGRGPERAKLRRQIDELGLYDRAFLMGPVSPIETEWAKGSIAAVSSDMESFGLTIVEAMHCGLPVVATDCPHGPGEIISDGEDGLLVPLEGGADAYAGALSTLIKDQELRERQGRAARAKAQRYAPATIGRRYERLFDDLAGERPRQEANAPAPGRTSLLNRLRGSFRGRGGRMAAAQDAKAADAAAPTPQVRPVAYVRATADGGMAVRFDAGSLPSGPLDFVVRRRKDPHHAEIRVPVAWGEAGAGQRTEPHATVERDAHVLAEGRWDCYVAPRGTDKRRRLVAGLVEQARLVTLPPLVGEDGVSAWIPYTTTDGFLALRTWLRPAHAEVTRILVGADSVTVSALLLGDATLPALAQGQGQGQGQGRVEAQAQGATVAAVSRQGADYDFATPVRDLGGGHFECTLSIGEALARRSVEHDLWDLRLLTTEGAEPIPLGRIGGDIVDRKKTDASPATEREHPQRGTTRAKPFFTAVNNLALSLRDTPQPDQITP
ncbi:glycosyltransferase family 4 protein [Streptomyces apocyni]|uniref:glycosyltransferase family 4 protein n=1 Tax=Streptomyces apocyni TaxID=2654677 RepID=UPI0012E9BE56|nr:glycosyltransferase family 4 protein [Streptomyces apocyni]